MRGATESGVKGIVIDAAGGACHRRSFIVFRLAKTMNEETHRTAGTTRRRYLRRAGGALSLAALGGCAGDAVDRTTTPVGDELHDVTVDHDETAWPAYDPGWTPPTAPPPTDYEVEVLAENLAIPWDLSVAPSGELFVSERIGRVSRYDGGELHAVAAPDDLIPTEATAPGTAERRWQIRGGEGGLLGLAVHPSYPDPPLVYAYYTAEREGGRHNRVVAFDGRGEGGPWPVIDGIPAHTFHNGGRLAFGPANYLWVTTGDADPGIETPERTRDPSSLAGSVLRVTPAGEPPAEGGNAGDARVRTYGHRNPQGLAWLPDGTPLATEHGPGGGDEVSVLRTGGDYGWPEVRDGDGFGAYAGTDYVPPVASAADWAPSGAVFYTGDELPGLRNRLLVGGLRSQRVVSVTLSHDSLGEGYDRYHDVAGSAYRAASTPLLEGFGRIRTLEQGRDGELYAITSNRDGRARDGFPTARDDRLLRIRAA
jgi:glucose/arabinose dehydrogenase